MYNLCGYIQSWTHKWEGTQNICLRLSWFTYNGIIPNFIYFPADYKAPLFLHLNIIPGAHILLFLVHPSDVWHLGWLCDLDIMNSTGVNEDIEVSVQFINWVSFTNTQERYSWVIWITYFLFIVSAGVCFLSFAVVLALETSLPISPEAGVILFSLWSGSLWEQASFLGGWCAFLLL